MNAVITKAVAEIHPGTVGEDEAPNGSFEVVLSAPTKDRDGDTLQPDEWKLPLPEHITFDADHGMSVASTVGSGVPRIEDDGTLRVSGTYSSIPRAQEVRTLVNEGHIRTTSVAFMTEKTQKAGGTTVVRELLNGAFVAVPSNREALVLASKGVKTGARNSAADAEHIQAIHDHAIALGATPAADGDEGSAKTATGLQTKAVAGSYEQVQAAISDALDATYGTDDGDRWVYAYPLATFADGTVVYRVSGNTDDNGQWRTTYTVNTDGTVTLGDSPERVSLVEQVVPAKSAARKAIADVDTTQLPEAVQRALAAGGITTPDDSGEGTSATDSADADSAAADTARRATVYRALAQLPTT